MADRIAVDLTENINTTTPSGKLTFHIFAALAEFERDILRQRVNRSSSRQGRRSS
jgi:DNA invertase Pin-like site-specific DNA recombinase